MQVNPEPLLTRHQTWVAQRTLLFLLMISLDLHLTDCRGVCVLYPAPVTQHLSSSPAVAHQNRAEATPESHVTRCRSFTYSTFFASSGNLRFKRHRATACHGQGLERPRDLTRVNCKWPLSWERRHSVMPDADC
ncbi:hypothetical protein RRG08_019052 [Elysia crispata]|uniref:Secreted protein n=1 Tax=Elysia crispata TaxID=231223 RepID=A0AAE1DSH5_9GAST|nr:hypothetical protein RRG08_019052 [Elysia crispata]